MMDQSTGLDTTVLEQWLYVLHGDCPGWSVVSSNLNWSGRAFKTDSDTWTSDIVRYVTALDQRGAKGIYLRVTTVGSEPEQGRRGRDEESVALPALWLDMDIAGPGHKPIKAPPGQVALPLPPDEETCRKIVRHSGLPEPTMWIHSGGGLYPYWFFNKPVLLDTPEAIDQWTAISQRLHETALWAAADLGYHYGTGTHDMSRVLRLPGTVNRKVEGAPTFARMYPQFEGSGITYYPEELDLSALPDVPHHEPPTPVTLTPSHPAARQEGLRPGEDYNVRGDVLYDILLPAGWQVHSQSRGEIFLTRPGKERRDGHSASLGYQGSNNLYVWSSDAGLPTDSPLSPFFLYAQYKHGGDFKAAARDLGGQGYGDPLPPPTSFPGLSSSPPPTSPVVPSEVIGDPLVSSGGGVLPPPLTPPPVTQDEAPGDDVRFIDVTDDTIATHAILAMLGKGKLHNLYEMHGKLVYAPSEAADVVRPIEGDGIVPLNAYAFRAHIGKHYAPYRRDKEGEWKRSVYSVTLANTVFAGLHLATNLRPLRGVSRLPIIRPDGTIWDIQGYDTQTQYIYLPDPSLTLPPVPSKPTPEEMAKAVGIIDLAIGEFPWVSQNDKNNFLGFMITPMLTKIVETPFKMGVIGAHQPGSGKTLLATILHILHGGAIMPSMSGGEDEMRKLITSNLMDTHETCSVFDNVSGTLSSASLDALLTSRKWKDRILGRSGTQEMCNDRMWVITGNNVSIGSDLKRRTVWSYINPNMPDPEKRHSFRIPDLLTWARANRGLLLWSLYTVIQGWVAAGRPTRCDKSDVFCGWVGTMNGILDVTPGWSGSFDAEESRQQSVSDVETEWTDLFTEIWDKFGEKEWTLSEILALINQSSMSSTTMSTNPLKPWSHDLIPADLVRDFMAGNTAVVSRTMGLRLKGIEGRFIGDVKVVQNPQRTRHGYRWHLVRYVKPVAPEEVTTPAAESPVLPAPHAESPTGAAHEPLSDVPGPLAPVGFYVPGPLETFGTRWAAPGESQFVGDQPDVWVGRDQSSPGSGSDSPSPPAGSPDTSPPDPSGVAPPPQ
jgi:hypothetical protein